MLLSRIKSLLQPHVGDALNPASEAAPKTSLAETVHKALELADQVSSRVLKEVESVRERVDDISQQLRDRVNDVQDGLDQIGSVVSDRLTEFDEAVKDKMASIQAVVDEARNRLDGYDFSRLPGGHIAHMDESRQGGMHAINLEPLGTEQAPLAWNVSLTAFALHSLGLSAAGQEGGLVSAIDESGRILTVTDDGGLAVLRLTLLEPGQGGNRSGTWAVGYEQFHGLAHPLGLLPNDLLALPLFINSTGEDGKVSANLLTLALTDDGPKIQFSSNFLILDLLGNNLLNATAEVTGGSFLAFMHKLVLDDNYQLDFTPAAMLQDLAQAAQNTLINTLSLDNLDALLDLASLLVNKDLGSDLKALLDGPLISLILGNQKDALLDVVDKYLDLTDTRRAVEGEGPATGELNVNFGLDGAATAHTRPVGWKLIHGDATPSATGWSVSGVRAMFDLLKVRASGHEDVRLTVTAAADENVFPPQTLLIRAGEVDVMTLRMTSDQGTYGYSIEQHTGLSHDQGGVFNTVLGLFQKLVGNNIDQGVEGLVDGIINSLTAGLGSVIQDLIGGVIGDIKALLLDALSIENITSTLSTDNLLYLPLPYITLDGDGDMAPNLLFHAIKDSVPSIVSLPENLLVAESDLAVGAFAGSDAGHVRENVGRGDSNEAVAQGQFSIKSFDGVGSVTVDGVVLWKDGQSVGTVNGHHGELIVTAITDNGDGVHTVHYQYSLTAAAEHVAPAQGADASRTLANPDEAERFVFIVADGDGDITETALAVAIQDDIPHPGSIAYSHTLNTDEFYYDGWTMQGALPLRYGADGPAQDQAFRIATRPSAGQPSQYLTPDADGQITVAGRYGDLLIDAESGQFSYVLDQARAEAAEPPKGYFETQVLPFTYDFRTPTTDATTFTGTLFSDVSGFKGKSWSDGNARAGLNSSALKSWMASSAATVAKDDQGFGVAGNAGNTLSSDGNKVGSGMQNLFTKITETLLMSLKEPAHELSIGFGDVTIGESGTVFFYDVEGGYLGSKSFGGLNIFADDFNSVQVTENEFSSAVGSFLVAPGTGSFTIESVSVPLPQQVWVEAPDQTFILRDEFSYILTDADGDQVEGFLGFDLGEPVFGDIAASDMQILVKGSPDGGVLHGGEQDALIVGGSGDDIIHVGAGHNQVWGHEGADVVVWSDVLFTAGSDQVMDFDFSEGDRLDYSALDCDAVQDLSLEGDVLSFTLKSGSAERSVDVHLKHAPDLAAVTAEYAASSPGEQQDLLMNLMKDISVV